MNEFTQAQITEHIEFVKRGKPCSVLPIRKNQIDVAIELSNNYGSLYYIEDIKNHEWVNFWIYKRLEMLEIIKQLPDSPKKPIDHFILGSAFGYSIDCILDYIKQNNNDAF